MALPTTYRWFLSRTVRRAAEMHRQIRRLVNEQRDELPEDSLRRLDEELASLRQAIQSAPVPQLAAQMSASEKKANELLKPYAHPGIRQNIKEILVAVVVILAITTFFLQLTKIPTGSMQPTLYGITHEDLKDNPQIIIPNRLERFFKYWVYGISYHHLVSKADGELRAVEPPRILLPFVKKQRLLIGDTWHTVWLPPDKLQERAGLMPGLTFKRGDDVFKLKVISGDHLFVDRFTYNFRRPRRGEIIVFKTRGIIELPQDQLYIKRLVALGGEKVQIGDDGHLIIDGRRLSAGDRHFEFIYNFASDPTAGYMGHVNGANGARLGRFGLAPLFPDEKAVLEVEEDHYLAMGDNTLNSFDSRAWGDFQQKNVIGKCWFVYWPITERFGWGYR